MNKTPNKDIKEDDMIKQHKVTDEEIDAVWGNAKFGSQDRREVILEALLQIGGGFSTGHTALCICQELGLVGKNKHSPVLTKKGKRIMYYWNKQALTALEHLTDTAALVERIAAEVAIITGDGSFQMHSRGKNAGLDAAIAIIKELRENT